MKKYGHRTLALLLVCAMLLALTACGASSQGTTETTAAEIEEETTQETETETEETEASDVVAEDTVSTGEETETEEAASTQTDVDSSSLYPVVDELTTITAFLSIAPWASAYIGPDAEFENAQAILTAEEYTNVHLEVTWSDPDTYNEKINLLVASDDLPHITRDISSLYSTGADGMIEDGLAVDLMPYFEEYAPEYYALLMSSDIFYSDVTTSNGTTVAMYSYSETPQYTRGPVVRMDMLEGAGVEIPSTVEELYEVAKALVATYDSLDGAIVSPKMVADAYYGADFISSNDTVMSWWVIGGEVTAAITLDSNYDWALEMQKWNEEGLFLDSWYTPEPFYDSYVLNDQLAIAYGPYSLTSDASISTAADPDTCSIVPMANVVLNEGDTIKTQDNSIGGRGDGDWCITTKDEDLIPQIVSYVNWFFTEEGIMVSNFGTEGVSYTIDENGEVQYTDLILEDTGGYGSMAVYAIFTNNNDNPFYFKQERTSLTYDNEIEATVYDTWLSNMTSEYMVNYKLTTEETEAYNVYATDVGTVIQEYMTKFMTGALTLNEETWADFQQRLVDLGIEEMREIVQGAVDRESES